MITVHVVNALNKHLYENEFDEFLRRRHDFFVHQKRWRPPSPDGRELDQFDTDAATYLLGLEDGRVVTSARLIPRLPASARSLVSIIRYWSGAERNYRLSKGYRHLKSKRRACA
ncbi:hypothetical protein NKJ46_32835 [Mesorhizobium sp. M0166]|uniref:acyl-homoserine-lactone synthase n=1 Tax=Mesorhizobium sp. M0166 TaxID=2956902 RepID=UPI00333A0F08